MKICDAAKLLRTREMSPRELMYDVLKNIDEKKSCGAYITVCDNAMKMAEAAEKMKTSSPMWGIPIGIKDNICTKGILTTAGSKMLSDFVPPYDATVVKKLKEQGAVLVGKTNMDEFGMGSEGRFSAFGEIKNPINDNFVPGGSSGGSAVAVACGMALGALGSDTGGSVRQPAAFCGLYGLKPTYSLLSRYGLIAFASSLDTIGIVGVSSEDVAIMLDATAGYDNKDATSVKCTNHGYYDNISADMKGIKIGILKNLCSDADDGGESVYNAATHFEKMGAIVEECSMNSVKYAVASYYIISSAEASANLSRYDGIKYGKGIEGFNKYEEYVRATRSENLGEEVKRRIMLGTYVLSEGYYDLYYMKAKSAQGIIASEFDLLFEKYDLLLSPVSPRKVWKKGEGGFREELYRKDLCTVLPSLARIPAMSIPVGEDENGMPIGLQIMGKRFCEQDILNAAFAYEKRK